MLNELQSSQQALDKMLATLGEIPGGDETLLANPDTALGVLEQIKPLLARFDTASGAVFEANRAMLLASLGPSGSILAKQLSSFDYPGALMTVQNAIQYMQDAKGTAT